MRSAVKLTVFSLGLFIAIDAAPHRAFAMDEAAWIGGQLVGATCAEESPPVNPALAASCAACVEIACGFAAGGEIATPEDYEDCLEGGLPQCIFPNVQPFPDWWYVPDTAPDFWMHPYAVPDPEPHPNPGWQPSPPPPWLGPVLLGAIVVVGAGIIITVGAPAIVPAAAGAGIVATILGWFGWGGGNGGA